MKSRFPIVELKKYVRQVSQRNRAEPDIEVFSVTNSEGFTKSTDYFAKEVFSKDVSNYKVVSPSQFAYNPSRINVGSIDYLRYGRPALVSPLYIVFEVNKDINADYLLRYLKSGWGNAQIRANTEGAVRDSLKFKGLENIKIPMPLLDDQIRIAHLLAKVEGLIVQRKQQLQQLDNLLKSVFMEMFGDPVRNENGWDTGPLIDFCDVKGGKRIPKGESLINENTGFPYIKAGNIKNGEVTMKDLEFVTPEVRKLISRYTVDEGDVCITVVGANIGDVGIVPTTLHKASLTENANKLLIKEKQRLNNHYLAHYLMSGYVQQQIASSIRAAGVPKLAIFRIEQMLLLVPPIGQQANFEKIKKLIQKITSRYHQSLTDLEALYGALSQQAFKGELDLSRVPLPDASNQEVQTSVIPTTQSSAGQSNEIHLPDTDLLVAALFDRACLKELLLFWLETYCSQLDGATFSAQAFLSVAQMRIEALHPDSDFELDANAYEQVKAWAFEALANGRLMQGYADDDNRVTLAVSAKQV